MKDYFISYSHLDDKWAEWIAWEIEDLGFNVIMQKWDFQPGTNFVLEMHSATFNAKNIILILSNNFLKSSFTGPEWSTFFAKDPDGSERLILPIRIEECNPKGLLAQIVYLDLYKKSQTECRSLLEETLLISGQRRKPIQKVPFPGTDVPKDAISPNFPNKSKRPKSVDKASAKISGNIIQSIINGNQYPFIRRRTTGRAFLRTALRRFLKIAQSTLDNNGESFAKSQSIIIVDVDGMSGINKKHGIETGDRVLDVIFHICDGLENRTVGGRLGDDTVFILLRNYDINSTKEIASTLVKSINQYEWDSIKNDLWVSCSSGIAALRYNENSDNFIARAIEAQILARKEGGNSVKVANSRSRNEWEKITS